MKDSSDVDISLIAIGKELEKDLNNWEAWAAKADLLFSIGMFEAAIRCCDKSLSLNPDDALAWMTKGKALDKLGKIEDAEAAFARASDLGYSGLFY